MHRPRYANRSLQVLARRFAALVIIACLAFGSASSAARPADRDAQNPPPQDLTDIAPSALAQIDALIQEKASRTAAQQKIDSQLIYGLKMSRGEAIAAGVQSLEVGLPYETDTPGPGS